MDKFKQEIIKSLKKEVKGGIELAVPPSPDMGDYAFPCFRLAKEFRKSPAEIAGELSKKIKPTGNIAKIAAEGPYLNFFVKKGSLAKDILENIWEKKEKYGSSGEDRAMMVEYLSPNTNKPLHLGHVRNICIGQSTANILSFLGNDVVHANVMNDRGIHICKSMLAYKRWGKGKKPDKKPDHFIGDFYVMYEKKKDEKLDAELSQMLKLWESGDKEVRQLWKMMNSWAYEGFDETLEKFGVKFGRVYHESELYDKGKEIIENACKKGILKREKDGAVIAELERYGMPDKVLLRSDGTSIYMTQDIYLAVIKFSEYNPDLSIYVSAVEQNLHFRQLFRILEMLGYEWASRCKHLTYGLVHLPEGRMKSREGNVVDADDLISEMRALAEKEIKARHKGLKGKELEARAGAIGLGALRFHMLLQDSVKDITYDPKKSIQFEGETGPYVQYAHARACSILRKSGKRPSSKVEFSLLNHPKETALAKRLGDFPSVLMGCSAHLKPSLLARYSVELAQLFSEFYRDCPIIHEKEELMKARLLLADSARAVLRTSLNLMGMDALCEM